MLKTVKNINIKIYNIYIYIYIKYKYALFPRLHCFVKVPDSHTIIKLIYEDICFGLIT